ncbi:MAG TPA: SDR family oxidoreductase [Candidatus Polarisedimenticolia bacterium]
MRTVLVTGANRGIGLELARQYATDGWRVHACCREPGSARELDLLQRASGGRVIPHRLDVTDAARIHALAAQLAGQPIDILLNNAGVYGTQGESFGNLAESDWIEVLRVNTLAPFRMAEAFVEHVAASGMKLFATISSKMGSIDDNTSGGRYAYRSSKAAVNMVTRSLAVDLRGRGITAVVLNPGWVRTRMGGAGAPLAVEESVGRIRAVLDRVTPAQSGQFLDHDGSVIPW